MIYLSSRTAPVPNWISKHVRVPDQTQPGRLDERDRLLMPRADGFQLLEIRFAMQLVCDLPRMPPLTALGH